LVVLPVGVLALSPAYLALVEQVFLTSLLQLFLEPAVWGLALFLVQLVFVGSQMYSVVQVEMGPSASWLRLVWQAVEVLENWLQKKQFGC
jgi:hypothetical protein